MYLISSCLVGINCRYNGTSTLNLALKKMIEEGKAIAVCPEVLAGLPTPRESCEIQNIAERCRVISKSGKDYTNAFVEAAKATLNICISQNISNAILQSRSPSCGFGEIYDGNFSGKLTIGNGLTAELLFKNGIKIFTDEKFTHPDFFIKIHKHA